MGHLDAENYTRVVPLSFDLRAEVDLYFERNSHVHDAAPDTPLFPAPRDPRKPVSDSAMFRSPQWIWEVGPDGEPILDGEGNKIPQQDADGRWLKKKSGGRFYRVEEIIRDDMDEQGLPWIELFPYERGSLVHSWRGHLEVLIESLEYIRRAITDSGDHINLTRHADYILGRKLEESTRFQHYIPLDPTILMGIVELREAEEVLAERGVRRAAEIAEGLGQIRRAREELRRARDVA
jgi:hypothetical protein